MPTQHLYLKVSKKPQNYLKLSPKISCNTQNTNIIWPQIIGFFQHFIFQWITPLFLQLDKSGGHPWHPAYLIHLHFLLLLPPTYIYWVPTWKAIVVHPGEFYGSIVDLSWTRIKPLLLQAMTFWDCLWSQNYLAHPFNLPPFLLLVWIVERLCLFYVFQESDTVLGHRRYSKVCWISE